MRIARPVFEPERFFRKTAGAACGIASSVPHKPRLSEASSGVGPFCLRVCCAFPFGAACAASPDAVIRICICPKTIYRFRKPLSTETTLQPPFERTLFFLCSFRFFPLRLHPLFPLFCIKNQRTRRQHAHCQNERDLSDAERLRGAEN